MNITVNGVTYSVMNEFELLEFIEAYYYDWGNLSHFVSNV